MFLKNASCFVLIPQNEQELQLITVHHPIGRWYRTESMFSSAVCKWGNHHKNWISTVIQISIVMYHTSQEAVQLQTLPNTMH